MGALPAICRINGTRIPASWGVHGPGESRMRSGRMRFNLFWRHLVVTPHHDLRAQFPKVLDEVVGKRIVIVEDEDHLNPV